jgi:hypothetical protein
MYYLKNYKYHISNTKHDMFRPFSEVIISNYKDKTDKNSYKHMVVCLTEP